MILLKEKNKNPYSKWEEVKVVFDEFEIDQLLPVFWRLVKSKTICHLHTDPERKIIVIPPNFFRQKGNFLSLLHEIGHANIDETKSEMEIEEEMTLRYKQTYFGFNCFSDTESKKYNDLIINSEEQAWSYAIDTILELRESGINLEPEITESDLYNLARTKLSSYFS